MPACGKALIIFGNQGSGKTIRAIQEAKKIGKFVITDIGKLYTQFGLGEILNNHPQVVIVEECPIHFLDDPKVEILISEDKLLIEKRGEDLRMVPNIKWIFTICLNRRFSTILV